MISASPSVLAHAIGTFYQQPCQSISVVICHLTGIFITTELTHVVKLGIAHVSCAWIGHLGKLTR